MPVYEHIEDYPKSPRYKFSPFMTKEELEHRNSLKLSFNKDLGTDFAPIGDYCIVTNEQYADSYISFNIIRW